ncbi:hypothetical protein DFJ74DRAFT_655369 [Hyaloraphidium curvatum]|nr:hypothetical protein DFJ74DRAFT_655369 [Hyaloraphidium curvatum]
MSFVASVNPSFPDLSTPNGRAFFSDHLAVTVRRVQFRAPDTPKAFKVRLTLRDVRQTTSSIDSAAGSVDAAFHFDVRFSPLLFARIKFDILAKKLLIEDKVARGRKRVREMVDSLLAREAFDPAKGISGEFSLPVYRPPEEPIFPRLGLQAEPYAVIHFTLSLRHSASAILGDLSPASPFADCVQVCDSYADFLQYDPALKERIMRAFRTTETMAARTGEERLAQFSGKKERESGAGSGPIGSMTLTFDDASATEVEGDLGGEPASRSISPTPSVDVDTGRNGETGEWSEAAASHDHASHGGIAITTSTRFRMRGITRAGDAAHGIVNGVISGLLRDGLRAEIGSPDYFRARALLDEAYEDVRRDLTYNAVTSKDLPLLKVANHFLRFAFAVYGSFITNLLTTRFDKLFLDAFQFRSDLRRFSQFCGVPLADIKLWSRASGPLNQLNGGDDVFAPVFALFWDAKSESVVIAIRGTHDLNAAMTDLAANVTYTGSIGAHDDLASHFGFAASAWRIRSRYYDIIKDFVREKQAARLVLTGHSLGAGVANVLFVYLLPHLEDLRTASGRGAVFDIRVFGFGTPACVEPAAAARRRDRVLNFVNHRDAVPSMCLGSLMDKIRIFQACSYLANDAAGDPKWGKADKQEKLRVVGEAIVAARAKGEPKLHVPGRIVYLFPAVDYVGINSWHPPEDSPWRHYVPTDPELSLAEWSEPERFASFDMSIVSLAWWVEYHLPDLYRLHLVRAIAAVEKGGLGVDGKEAGWGEANAERRALWDPAAEAGQSFDPACW